MVVRHSIKSSKVDSLLSSCLQAVGEQITRVYHDPELLCIHTDQALSMDLTF